MESVVSVDNPDKDDLTKEGVPALPGFTIDIDPEFPDPLTAPIHTLKSHHHKQPNQPHHNALKQQQYQAPLKRQQFQIPSRYSIEDQGESMENADNDFQPQAYYTEENLEGAWKDKYAPAAAIHNPYSYILNNKAPIYFDFKDIEAQRRSAFAEQNYQTPEPTITSPPWAWSSNRRSQYQPTFEKIIQSPEVNLFTANEPNVLQADDHRTRFEDNTDDGYDALSKGSSEESTAKDYHEINTDKGPRNTAPEYWLKKRTEEKMEEESDNMSNLKNIYSFGIALAKNKVQIVYCKCLCEIIVGSQKVKSQIF